jgi:c-di-GMP-binding flagellar brake protein YcgR
VAGILSSLKKLFNRRRHKRYFVKDGTLVVISPGNVENPEKVVQLIDISNGGMAFVYQGSPADIEKSSLLQVVTQQPPYRTESIRFDTVSDEPVAEDAQTSEQFRRRGIKFRWMGFFDETAFKNLIDEIKICEK